MGLFGNWFGSDDGDDVEFDKDSGLELGELDNDPLDGNSGAGMQSQQGSQPGMGSSGFSQPRNPQPSSNPSSSVNKDFDDPFEDHKDYKYDKKKTSETSSGDVEKDLKMVLEKLDSVKASVNSLHHRLDKLEEKNKDKMWK